MLCEVKHFSKCSVLCVTTSYLQDAKKFCNVLILHATTTKEVKLLTIIIAIWFYQSFVSELLQIQAFTCQFIFVCFCFVC